MNKTFEKTDTFERKQTADVPGGRLCSVGNSWVTSYITEDRKQTRSVRANNGIFRPCLDRKSKYSMFSVSLTSKSAQHCPVLLLVAWRHV